MVGEISTDEVKEKLEGGEEIQVIDIREEDDFAAGHIPGAENVPMSELPSRIDDVEWSDFIVVACPIGQSSVQAGRLIESYEGVDDEKTVVNMEGGYDAWDHELESER